MRYLLAYLCLASLLAAQDELPANRPKLDTFFLQFQGLEKAEIVDPKVVGAKPDKLAVKRTPRRLMPFDAALIALADAKKFDPIKDGQFLRYLFLPHGTDFHHQVYNWTLNLTISQSLNIRYAVVIHPQILRIDLRDFAPLRRDLDNLIKVWEELAFDPYFHEFLILQDDTDVTRDIAVEAFKLFNAEFLAASAEWTEDNRKRWVEFLNLGELQFELSKDRVFDLVILQQFVDAVNELEKAVGGRYKKLDETLVVLREAVKQLIRQAGKTQVKEAKDNRTSGQGALGANEEIVIPARHAGIQFALLSDVLNTDAPIVWGPYFFHRATSSIDRGHGAGLYYLFSDVRINVNDGLTDFQRLFLDLGIDFNQVKDLRGRNSTVQQRSLVTARYRAVRYVQGSGERPSAGPALVVYTEDPADEQVAARNHVLRNLQKPEVAAIEMISHRKRANGFLLFTLFAAANGALQNSAPDNVVKDHEAPRPYTARLDACGTCLRCHAVNHGHMVPRNDLLKLTAAGVDILDDVANADGLEDFLDALVAEFQWDPEDPTPANPLVISRDAFDRASVRATSGIIKQLPQGQRLIHTYPKGWDAKVACDNWASYYAEYAYATITPVVALQELGYDVKDDGEALRMLRQVLPSQPPDGFGLTLLDIDIESLRAGIDITRPAWELVYFDAALRALITSGAIADKELEKQRKLPSGKRPLKKRKVVPLSQREFLNRFTNDKALSPHGKTKVGGFGGKM